MGLDINLSILDQKKFYQKAKELGIDLSKIGLSRTFCNLFFRRDIVEHESELSQIEKLIGVNLDDIIQMTWFTEEDDMSAQLGIYDTEEEKQEFIDQIQETNNKLQGNLNRVLATLENLIAQLTEIEDLPKKLIKTNRDTLGNDQYFSRFKEDLGDGYIGNNFGQDLRNLVEVIKFVKSIGEKTVYFSFG